MMSLYPFALFAHIVGVLSLFMAIALEMSSIVGMRRASSIDQVRTWANLSAVSDRIFPLASLLTLIAGVYMAFVGWGWQVAWIDVSLLVLILMSIVGPLVNSRRLRMIHNAAEKIPAGPVPQSLTQMIEDPVLWTGVQTLSMMALGVVFLMTTKPGSLETMIVLIVSVVLGMLSVPVSKRLRRRAVTRQAHA